MWLFRRRRGIVVFWWRVSLLVVEILGVTIRDLEGNGSIIMFFPSRLPVKDGLVDNTYLTLT